MDVRQRPRRRHEAPTLHRVLSEFDATIPIVTDYFLRSGRPSSGRHPSEGRSSSTDAAKGRPCRFCARSVRKTAIACDHCGATFTNSTLSPLSRPPIRRSVTTSKRLIILVLGVLILNWVVSEGCTSASAHPELGRTGGPRTPAQEKEAQSIRVVNTPTEPLA